MKRAVGSLDKRKRVSRCQACAKRRIKCQGGFPCEYCNRTNKKCNPQAVTPPTYLNVQFVAYAPPQRRAATAITLPVQVQSHDNDAYLRSFAELLYRCQFTKDFVHIGRDLLPLMHTSPALRDLGIAIGALDASRRASTRASLEHEWPQCVAYRSYSRSLQSLQLQLQKKDAGTSQDVAWSTFLLGLFELMAEPSGDRWAKHMFYGTSKVLQLAGPDAHQSTLQKRLLSAFRVLEANRAILYGDDTFLSKGRWSLNNRIRTKEAEIPDPMSEITELMIQTSRFSKQLFETIEDIPTEKRSDSSEVKALAREGTALDHRIAIWNDGGLLQSAAEDPFNQISFAYYYALQLFHCRNFTYYSCWEPGAVPELSSLETNAYIAAITNICEKIIQTSNIPGVILLFPLRMAGAHAEVGQRNRILKFLQQIYNSGFVVADKIKEDLCDFWTYKELEVLTEISS
ncbi:fungal-specific transcription factor domain-containing protein [Trichoderma evansii]